MTEVNNDQQKINTALLLVLNIVMVLGLALALNVSMRLSVPPTDVYKQVVELREELRKSKGDAQVVFDVLEQSGSAVVGVDENGIITMWSDGASKFFGTKRADVFGYGVAHLIPQGMRDAHRSSFSSAMGAPAKPFQQTVDCVAKTATSDSDPVRISIWGIPGRLAIAIFSKREAI